MQEPTKTYDAEVILVNSNIDDNRTAMAHCHFLKKPSNILPGMLVEAVISVNSKSASVLPEDAIIEQENKKYVFIAAGNNMFKMVEIKTGNNTQGYVEIVSDTALLPKDSIVVVNANKLLAISSTRE
jgi:cobalt-zinc-cadmium efflux system membrane fusion protein